MNYRTPLRSLFICIAIFCTSLFSDDPRQYPARTFNSTYDFEVWMLEDPLDNPRKLGDTPSESPINIPQGQLWMIKPGFESPSMQYIIKEIRKNKVPGLSLSFDEAVDAKLELLENLTCLEYLQLSECWKTTDDGLASISTIKGLRWLDLQEEDSFTGKGLQSLTLLKDLEVLNLTFWNIGTGPRFAFLNTLNWPDTLIISFCTVSDDGLLFLDSWKELDALRLSNCEITDEGIRPITKLAELERLEIWQCDQLTNAGFAAAASLPTLRMLSITDCQHFTGEGIVFPKSLTELDLSNNNSLKDEALESLAGHTALKTLDLSCCWEISDNALHHLENLQSLETLNVRNSAVTTLGVNDLKEHLPDCDIVTGSSIHDLFSELPGYLKTKEILSKGQPLLVIILAVGLPVCVLAITLFFILKRYLNKRRPPVKPDEGARRTRKYTIKITRTRIIICSVCFLILGVALFCYLYMNKPEPQRDPVAEQVWYYLEEADDHNIISRMQKGYPSNQTLGAELVAMGKKAVPTLVDALDDRRGPIRHRAAWALGEIGTEADVVVPALVEAYEKEPYFRSAMAEAINKLGRTDIGIPLLIKLLKRDNNQERRNAIKALEELGKKAEAATPLLCDVLLNDDDEWSRMLAAGALAETGENQDEVCTAMVSALDDDDQKVRSSAASALCKIKVDPDHAVPALITALNDPYNSVIYFAARALGNIGPPASEAIPSLTELSHDPDESVRNEAREALKKIRTTKSSSRPVTNKTE